MSTINRHDYERLRREGFRETDIARELGTNRTSLYRWRKENGIPSGPPVRDVYNGLTPKDYREERKWHSDQEIADQHYISLPTLDRWKKRHGLTRTLSREELKELMDAGYTQQQIAQQVNRAQGTISYLVKKYGLGKETVQ